MQRVVTAEQMRRCDETAIRKAGIPGMLLMENAGAAVARHVVACAGSAEGHIVILCGRGNNGGDGFVVARHLLQYEMRVTVVTFFRPSELRGDTAANFKLLRSLVRSSHGQLVIQAGSSARLTTLKPNVVVDALFGTGFSGRVKSPFKRAIEWANSQQCPVISVDIPSGVNGTTGVSEGCHVIAGSTVTFGLMKTGLLCSEGLSAAGKATVEPIGFPRSVTESIMPATFVAERTDVSVIVPRPPKHAHKYSVGKVLVIGGSKGLTGAAAMAAQSALRAGAGAVVLAAPESVAPVLARKLTEVMVHPLTATPEGTLSLAALDQLSLRMEWSDVIVLGPGLSVNQETIALVERILATFRGRLLMDADALNAVAAIGLPQLKRSQAEILLTPHIGEFARLTGTQGMAIESNRIDEARSFSVRHGCTTVLKGVPTVTAGTDGTCILNSTGNPGMATAGSGDVLSGIIGAIWSQHMSAFQSAYAGVYIHGLAGDDAARRYGQRSLLAGDILASISGVLRSLEQGV